MTEQGSSGRDPSTAADDDRAGCHAGIQIGMGRRSARRALRHLDFGLQDRPQARQSVAECDEPVWSGKRCPSEFRGPPAASCGLGSDRAVWRALSIGGTAGVNGSGRCGLMIPATSCRRICTLWCVERRSLSKRWNSPTARNRGRHGRPAISGGKRRSERVGPLARRQSWHRPGSARRHRTAT